MDRDARPLLTGSLPMPLSSLVGRVDELALITELITLSELRILTLTGPGGVGKTMLALHAARLAVDAFPDGVWFVPLATVTDPDHVLPAVIKAFGLPDASETSVEGRLQVVLRGKRILLVLDNLEQVVQVSPRLAGLLQSCPGVTALATSRVRLRVSGEREFPVPPLQLPSGDSHALAGTDQESEAERLFVERAQAVKPGFALAAEDRTAVAAICSRLDGLPLAIELAAARVKVLQPAALLARLERRLPLLTGGNRDLPERQQTMRHAISWSYELLGTEEQALFRRLAVFVGGFSLEQAEEVAAAQAALGIDLLDGVSVLVDASLLQQVDGPGGLPRYRMLETIREFGLEQLVGFGEEGDVRGAHAFAFLRLAEAADLGLLHADPIHGLARDRLVSERDNVRAALRWFAEHWEEEACARLAGALGHFWFMLSDFEEGLGWLERAYQPRQPIAPAARALALRWAGMLALYRLDIDRASIYMDESLALYEELGDTYGTALALVGTGLVGLYQGDFRRALELHLEALSRARSFDDDQPGPVFLATVCLQNLGAVAYGAGNLAQATGYFEEALRRVQRLGHSSLALLPLTGLGNVMRDQGDLKRATSLYSEALEQAGKRGNKRIQVYALAGLASIAGTLDDQKQAARLFGAADVLQDMIGVPVLPAFYRNHARSLNAVRSVLPGEDFEAEWNAGRAMRLSEAIAEAADVGAKLPPVSAPKPRPDSGLTPRELEVLRLLTEGHTDREIAGFLSISPRTVGAHVTNLLAKLGVETRTAAAAFALRSGLA